MPVVETVAVVKDGEMFDPLVVVEMPGPLHV